MIFCEMTLKMGGFYYNNQTNSSQFTIYRQYLTKISVNFCNFGV